jgi:hypothetical protein
MVAGSRAVVDDLPVLDVQAAAGVVLDDRDRAPGAAAVLARVVDDRALQRAPGDVIEDQRGELDGVVRTEREDGVGAPVEGAPMAGGQARDDPVRPVLATVEGRGLAVAGIPTRIDSTYLEADHGVEGVGGVHRDRRLDRRVSLLRTDVLGERVEAGQPVAQEHRLAGRDDRPA